MNIDDYTETMHVICLGIMLEQPDPCWRCPTHIFKLLPYQDKEDPCCKICRDFVGAKGIECPCTKFGKHEAIKRTYITMEEKGYI